MATRKQLQSALDSLPATLSRFDEFVGVGAVPRDDHDGRLVIAIYVSKPIAQLSREFTARIPASVPVRTNTGMSAVQTKIVNLGHLEP